MPDEQRLDPAFLHDAPIASDQRPGGALTMDERSHESVGSIADGLDRSIREVQMENVHPLRLRLLIEIARTGSISAAAERCVIGQPSASMHLRSLEAAIGQRLVTRTGRGSRLTPAGKVVATHGEAVLAALESMRRTLDFLDNRNVSELTVAATLTASVALLPAILRQFSEAGPSVRIKLRTLPSESVVREVASGGADVGVAGDVPPAGSVSRRQILVDELIGIAAPGVLPASNGSVTLEELAPHHLLVGSEESSTRMVTERCLAESDFRPARVWVFDSYQAITRAVADGLGISFVSQLLVAEEVKRGELVAFRVPEIEPMSRAVHLVRSSERRPTPEATAFMALLADLGGSVGGG